MRVVRAPPAHHWGRSYVTSQTNWIDEVALRSPTALAMALERAIAVDDRRLERATLLALAKLGIVVVDRTTLTESLQSTGCGGRR
jgi:uncharacterized membrane protein